MSDAYVYIPGAAATAAVEHLKTRLVEVFENSKVKAEVVLARFFKDDVNTMWARWNTPGNRWCRKILTREESDELFFKMYERSDDHPWPMWAIWNLEAYSNVEDLFHRRENLFKETIATFSAGLDVYLPQRNFQGILKLDVFFKEHGVPGGWNVPSPGKIPTQILSSS